MTAGRFDAHGQGESDGRAEPWQPSGSWEDVETWDYDEARAHPEAYDQLEARLMHDREPGPSFTRFQAAIADAPPAMAAIEVPRCKLRPADPAWLDAIKTRRLWASALWLVGAAGAGVVAGLVSTNLVALALNPAASDVLAEPSALSAPAPSSITGLAQANARQLPGSGRAAWIRAQAASSDRASRTDAAAPVAVLVPAEPAAQIQVAAVARPVASMPEAGPNLDPSAPPAAQLAALVEPAPEPAPAAPIERPAPLVSVPAEPTAQEPAPTPPPAAAEARVTTPLAPATAAAPTPGYRVQLALLRNQRNAKYVWHDFVAHFGPAAKKFHRYEFATQTARGTRHLVQVGPFADEGQAEAMCSKLKQRGGDCLVVREPS